jgi:hypothetical protein
MVSSCSCHHAMALSRLSAHHARLPPPPMHCATAGRQVLVMEWIDGLRCTDPDGIRASGLDVEQFIRCGVVSGLRQLLEFGLFHGQSVGGWDGKREVGQARAGILRARCTRVGAVAFPGVRCQHPFNAACGLCGRHVWWSVNLRGINQESGPAMLLLSFTFFTASTHCFLRRRSSSRCGFCALWDLFNSPAATGHLLAVLSSGCGDLVC